MIKEEIFGKLSVDDCLLLIQGMASYLMERPKETLDKPSSEVWIKLVELFKKNTPFMVPIEKLTTKLDMEMEREKTAFAEKLSHVLFNPQYEEESFSKKEQKEIRKIIQLCRHYLMFEKVHAQDGIKKQKTFDAEFFQKCMMYEYLQNDSLRKRDSKELMKFLMQEKVLSYVIHDEGIQKNMLDFERTNRNRLEIIHGTENTEFSMIQKYLEIIFHETLFHFPHVEKVPSRNRAERNLFLKKIVQKVDPITYFYLVDEEVRSDILQLDEILEEDFKNCQQAVVNLIQYVIEQKTSDTLKSKEKICDLIEKLESSQEIKKFYLLIRNAIKSQFKAKDSLSFLLSLDEKKLHRHFNFMFNYGDKIVSIMDYCFVLQQREWNERKNGDQNKKNKKDTRAEIIKIVANTRMHHLTKQSTVSESEFRITIFENCETMIENLRKTHQLSNVFIKDMDEGLLVMASTATLTDRLITEVNGSSQLKADYEDTIINFIRMNFHLKQHTLPPKLRMLTENKHKSEDKFDGFIKKELRNFKKRYEYSTRKAA